MKLCIILLVLAVGSQGFLLNELKETFGKIGDAFTATFQTVGEQAKTVGQGLLETLKQQGTELAGQAVQSLLLGGMQALQTPGTDSTTGTKRDVADLKQSLEKFIESKLDEHKELLTTTIDALSSVGALIPANTKLSTIISTVDNLVHAHNTASNKLTDELIEGVLAHYAKALSGNKRGLSDLLGQLGTTIANLFQPALEQGKGLVQGLATTVKQTAQQTAGTAQPHIDAMTSSSQAIVQHGKNALSALKDAVTDILQQTLTNIQPHLTNIAQHATQTVVESGHQFVNNLGSAVSATLAQAQQPQPVV